MDGHEVAITEDSFIHASTIEEIRDRNGGDVKITCLFPPIQEMWYYNNNS
jgi:hypothetical protein